MPLPANASLPAKPEATIAATADSQLCDTLESTTLYKTCDYLNDSPSRNDSSHPIDSKQLRDDTENAHTTYFGYGKSTSHSTQSGSSETKASDPEPSQHNETTEVGTQKTLKGLDSDEEDIGGHRKCTRCKSRFYNCFPAHKLAHVAKTNQCYHCYRKSKACSLSDKISRSFCGYGCCSP